MRVLLLAKTAWATAKDAEMTEKVWTASIMARKSQVEMVICCAGGADELGQAKSI